MPNVSSLAQQKQGKVCIIVPIAPVTELNIPVSVA